MLVILFMYRLHNARIIYFHDILFSVLKYPQNMWFNFENKITAHRHPGWRGQLTRPVMFILGVSPPLPFVFFGSSVSVPVFPCPRFGIVRYLRVSLYFLSRPFCLLPSEFGLSRVFYFISYSLFIFIPLHCNTPLTARVARRAAPTWPSADPPLIWGLALMPRAGEYTRCND